MDCSPPGSSVHGIFQARILEWVAISFSRGSSQPRDRTRISSIGRWALWHCTTAAVAARDRNLLAMTLRKTAWKNSASWTFQSVLLKSRPKCSPAPFCCSWILSSGQVSGVPCTRVRLVCIRLVPRSKKQLATYCLPEEVQILLPAPGAVHYWFCFPLLCNI